MAVNQDPKAAPLSPEALREWLRHAVEHAGVSPTELAHRARVSPSTLHRPLNNPDWKFNLSLGTLAAVADAAGVPLPETTPPNAADIARYARYARQGAKPYRLGQGRTRVIDPLAGSGGFIAHANRSGRGRGGLPVFGSAQGSSEPNVVDVDNPIDVLAPFGPLQDVPGGFALRISGESMEPRFFDGDLLLVHPTARPHKGDPVVVLLAPAGAHAGSEAIVKLYVRQDAEALVLDQYNPRLATDNLLRVPLERLQGVHPIVGVYYPR